MLWNLLDVISWVAVIWLTYSIVDYFKSEPPLARGGSDLFLNHFVPAEPVGFYFAHKLASDEGRVFALGVHCFGGELPALFRVEQEEVGRVAGPEGVHRNAENAPGVVAPELEHFYFGNHALAHQLPG